MSTVPMSTATPGSVCRLLILDDDPMVGLLLETVARMAGAQVRRMQTGDEFFAALEAEAPTHIVLDLTMPGLSGEEVLRGLAERACRARIIVASGASADRLEAALTLARAGSLNVAGALSKPFMPAALRVMLDLP